MSQVTYEIIRKLFEIYPIILQIVLFLVLWNVFFPVGERVMDCCRNIGSDEYLHGGYGWKARG